MRDNINRTRRAEGSIAQSLQGMVGYRIACCKVKVRSWRGPEVVCAPAGRLSFYRKSQGFTQGFIRLCSQHKLPNYDHEVPEEVADSERSNASLFSNDQCFFLTSGPFCSPFRIAW